MAGAHILFYSLAKFDTVHDRHHDITDNDVGNSCLCQFPAFFAILGSDYFIKELRMYSRMSALSSTTSTMG